MKCFPPASASIDLELIYELCIGIDFVVVTNIPISECLCDADSPVSLGCFKSAHKNPCKLSSNLL